MIVKTDSTKEMVENGYKYESEYYDYLKGKSVILVGPANYVKGRGAGIDTYDVVVRLNLSCPVPENLHKDIGQRTDVLYHVLVRKRHIDSMPELFKKLSKEEVQSWVDGGLQWLTLKWQPQKLMKMGANIQDFYSAVKGVVDWTACGKGTQTQMKGLRPNIGTIAIAHLLNAPIKSLHVIGCDYHQSPYFTGYGGFTKEQAEKGVGGYHNWGQSGPGRVVHPPKAQLKFLSKLLESDKRFSVDQRLSSIISRCK